MPESIFVALIVGGLAIFGQVVTGVMAGRAKREDWRRQDEVAAKLLENDAKTEGQLIEIHGLVNSTLTRSLESELAGARRELLMAEELGRPRATIDQVKARVSELTSTLNERGE